jgi:hypothetical protein
MRHKEKVIFRNDYPLLPVSSYLKETEAADLPEEWREQRVAEFTVRRAHPTLTVPNSPKVRRPCNLSKPRFLMLYI